MPVFAVLGNDVLAFELCDVAGRVMHECRKHATVFARGALEPLDVLCVPTLAKGIGHW